MEFFTEYDYETSFLGNVSTAKKANSLLQK